MATVTLLRQAAVRGHVGRWAPARTGHCVTARFPQSRTTTPKCSGSDRHRVLWPAAATAAVTSQSDLLQPSQHQPRRSAALTWCQVGAVTEDTAANFRNISVS